MEPIETNNIKVNDQIESLTTYRLTDSDSIEEILLNPYTQTVKEFMLAMIDAGYNYEDNNELCIMAIQATDKLIEKISNQENSQQ
ncbi:MAG: hypothetical protein AAGE84_12695 [Cyanobacteria bacterium P01_G01_bin.39]